MLTPSRTLRTLSYAFLTAAILVAWLAGASPASGAAISLAGASQYAVFVLGSPDATIDKFSMNNSVVNGNIACGAGTSYNWSGSGGPYGPNIYYQTGNTVPPVANLGGTPTPTAVARNLVPDITDALNAGTQ